MNEDKLNTLRSSWSKVLPLRESVAMLFYDRLFELDPNVRALFSTNRMSDQYQKLLEAMDFVVKNAHKADCLLPTLEELGKRHATYGVKDHHYEIVGAALLWTLEQGLQDEWSEDVKNAWSEAYIMVSTVMKQATSDTVELATVG